jgi:predicted molibdopterin-dependent oxidoreductase YjgC
MRISGGHRFLPAVERGRAVTIVVNGEPLEAYAGETVAAALLASGRRAFRHTDKSGAPRGVFCGMGVCYDCLVTVDGVPNVRACVTQICDGMVVRTKDDG